MSDIVWGPAIAIKHPAKFPAWLKVNEPMQYQTSDNAKWFDMKWGWGWDCVGGDIRLPADHFAYTAIAKDFIPWGGGSEAPEDWDEGDVLLRDGSTAKPYGGGSPKYSCLWSHDNTDADAIGYHPKPIAQPSPADTVTVKRMAEDDALSWLRAYTGGDGYPRMLVLRELGLIRPTTKAERIAKSTNLPLADVERVLAVAAGEGE